MFKALIEIGDYKPGDIVPDEKAKIWAQMYLVSPVVEMKENLELAVPKKEDSQIMSDDYLERPTTVVVNNIKKDKLSKKILLGLLDMEKDGKKRKAVIDAITEELK